jgi:hypothetical protein
MEIGSPAARWDSILCLARWVLFLLGSCQFGRFSASLRRSFIIDWQGRTLATRLTSLSGIFLIAIWQQ